MRPNCNMNGFSRTICPLQPERLRTWTSRCKLVDMLILHAVWLPEAGAQAAHLALWGESGPELTAPGGRGLARHPFSALLHTLTTALPGLAAAEETTLTLRLPTVGKWPQP